MAAAQWRRHVVEVRGVGATKHCGGRKRGFPCENRT